MMLTNSLMLFNLGNGEIVVIVLILLLLFGAKKIPELARGMGKGVREFKDATKQVTEEMHRAQAPGAPDINVTTTAGPSTIADEPAKPAGL